MTKALCEYLDDYVLKDLDPEVEKAFADHLADCEACRLTVEHEARINGLIKTAADAICCPPELTARIQQESQRRTHRPWAKAGSVLAVGLVIGLLGWTILSRIPPVETRRNGPVAEETLPVPDLEPALDSEESPDEIANAKPASPVRVEFPEDLLALPIDSGEPDITLIQLFPVTSVSQTSP